MVSRSSEEAMNVHMHTRFCLLCVLTFLFQQCSHCHGDGHRHHDHAHSHEHNDLQISQAPYTQTGGDEESLGSAESEQRFFIQQLFRRYGQRDRLDFSGFQSLLLSLGLGEVKVVGLEHDDLGHDHVAHLDLLEVQEGRHSHSPDHPDYPPHAHADHPPYAHPHPHPHPHLEGGEEPDSSVCKETAHPTAAPASNGDVGDHHDHVDDHEGTRNGTERKEKQARHRRKRPHAHRQHKHNATGSHSAGSHGGEGPELTQSGQGEDAGQSGQLDQSGQPDSAAQLEQLGSAEPPVSPDYKPKRTRRPLRNKGPRNKPGGSPTLSPSPFAPRDYGNAGKGTQNQDGGKKLPKGSPDPPQEHDHDHEHGNGHVQDRNHEHMDGHLHVRRREAPESPGDSAPAISANHLKDLEHHHEECLNLSQLLHHYGLSADSLISPNTFTYLCPALLYQIDSRVCIHHYHQVDIPHAATEPSHSALIWVWGFLSITIISLLSLLGVVLVPILNQSCFKFLLTFLVALAVGTLSGDALLHLLPHSQGQHDHSHETNHSNPTADLLEDFDGVWKGLTALAGIYLLFIIEHCIGMFQHYKDQGGSWCRRRRKGDQPMIGRKLSDHKLNRRSDAEWLHLKPLTADGADSSMLSCDSKHDTTQLSELPDPSSPCKQPLTPQGPEGDGAGARSSAADNGRKAKTKRFGHGHSHGHTHSHGHAHQGHCHSDQEMKDAGVASIAWMVIMGDGMHNFSDGLAIGAAFSANVTGGISTSVAVFCHELPHELGDFAVLLKAGMSVRQAIVYNVLSALMAYVGMLIGTAVGQYTHNVTSWIFAVTAGMFLYVALVDMLPEMLHGDSEDHKRCQFGHFLLQNLGMLTGFAIMLLIAIFEDRIVLDFGF